MNMFLQVLYAIGSYLVGSMPAVYLIGKARGVDLHAQGTGNVGGGNLWQTAGALEGMAGGLADILKGLVPVLVARWLGFGPAGLALAAAGCISGQMWPVFLRFRGGRGNGMALGIGLVLGPREIGLSVIPMLGAGFLWLIPKMLRMSEARRQRFRFLGARTKTVPVCMLLGFVLLPVFSFALHEEPRFVAASAMVPALIIIRRLTADLFNDLRQPEGRPAIFMNRLLFDRRERDGAKATVPQPRPAGNGR